jgi:magnesium-transporting ATPase (P-type)
MNNRDARVKKCLEELESNMTLIGVTAVEDLLQYSVRSCIEHIREARIKGNLN